MRANLFNMTIDTLTILKDAGAVTASAAAQVGGAARVVDLGASTTPSQGMGDAPVTPAAVIVDVTAIDISSNDEHYILIFQASSSPTFASDVVNCCALDLGAAAVLFGGATVATTVGRYILPVLNWQNKVYRRYVRMFHTILGTTPSINYTAAMVPRIH